MSQSANAPVSSARRIGVLLMNLGTPDATDYSSMRRYLKEFLSDRRVIEEPRLKWWLILNLIILTVRPGPKGRDYEKIWNRERNESPLTSITREQAEKLQAALADGRVVVDWAMRYGNPAVAARLAAMQAQGCDRILIVPLYPQYAAATTATACDHAFRALMAMRRQPTVRVAPPYFDDQAYIEAVAASISEHLGELDLEPEVLVMSFHGMPEKYADAGDPYPGHCRETARLVRERLGWPEARWHMTYQSRFGNDPWLKPYTIDTVAHLARSGVKSLAMVAPGFSADCLETLEEINIENRQAFLDNGGERFAYIPCLNASPLGIGVIESIVRRELAGWM
jgi:ferrochelatase